MGSNVNPLFLKRQEKNDTLFLIVKFLILYITYIVSQLHFVHVADILVGVLNKTKKKTQVAS